MTDIITCEHLTIVDGSRERCTKMAVRLAGRYTEYEVPVCEDHSHIYQ